MTIDPNSTGSATEKEIAAFFSTLVPSTLDSVNDVEISGVTDGQVLTYSSGSRTWINENPTGGGGGGGNGGDLIATFTQPGVLTTGTGVVRFTMPAAGTLVKVLLSVNTAPTGAAILVDLNKNGTTVFTTQANRPTISAASFASNAAIPAVTAFTAGDYFTPDIDQVGSSVAGSNLVIQVVYTLT